LAAGFSLSVVLPDWIALSQSGVVSSVSEGVLLEAVAIRIQSGTGPSTGDSISLSDDSELLGALFFSESLIILTLTSDFVEIFGRERAATHHNIYYAMV
jgi:hypothetical protein